MNCCRETVKMVVSLGNRRELDLRRTCEWHVAVHDTRGRPEGQPYTQSQQVIHETSGLKAYGLHCVLDRGPVQLAS